MKRFFLVPLIILLLAFGAWAQPVNEPTFLGCDSLTDPAIVERSLVEIQGIEQEPELCLYDQMTDWTKLFNLSNFLPGPWSMRARVLGASAGDVVGQWSGWSNTLTVTKPNTVVMRTENGYLVTNSQPGIAISQIYINGAVEQGLLEPITGGVRLYDLSILPEGTTELWAQLVHVSGWEGDWPANPIVVTKTAAPPAPVLRIQVE